MDAKKLKHAVQAFFQAMKSKNYIPVEHVSDKENLLDSKVVLIVGASGGIGSEIARTFAKSGARVILAARNTRKLEKLTKEIGPNAKWIQFDISDVQGIKDTVNKAVEIYGRIDALVNVAGIHSTKSMTNFFNTTIEDWENIMKVNLEGMYFTCQAVAQYFVDSKIKGHILNISSSTGAEPAWSAYRLSKRDIEGLTLGLAQVLTKYGITVNGIAPGSTATSLLGVKEGDSIYTTDNDVGRYVMPDEVATYALLLISDLGNMVVGDTLYISGGRGTYDIR